MSQWSIVILQVLTPSGKKCSRDETLALVYFSAGSLVDFHKQTPISFHSLRDLWSSQYVLLWFPQKITTVNTEFYLCAPVVWDELRSLKLYCCVLCEFTQNRATFSNALSMWFPQRSTVFWYSLLVLLWFSPRSTSLLHSFHGPYQGEVQSVSGSYYL